MQKTRSSDKNSSKALSLHEAIDTDKSFANFDMNLSSSEKQAIQNLKVEKDNTYDNFAATDRLKSDAERFLRSVGNKREDAKAGAEIIDRMISEITSAFNAEKAWVSIRAFVSNDTFDIPRWHMDGYFFQPYKGDHHKVAFVLKGAPTLFNDIAENMRGPFKERLRSFSNDSSESRRKIAELIDPALTSTAEQWQGSIFIVGSDRAGVHSEPPMHLERIFISVVPGTKTQIEELRERWKRKPSSYEDQIE